MATRPDTYSIWPGFELEASRDVTTVDASHNELDKSWHIFDDAGHGHFVTNDGKPPTLKWVHEPCDMHDDDCDGEGHWECNLCGEEVRPRFRWVDKQEMIPGPTHFTVTERRSTGTITYSFGEDTWQQVQNAVTTAVRSVLEDHMVSRTWEAR